MASTTPNTIILKGNGIRKEGAASAAITPGHLIEFGGANDLRVHAAAGTNARKAFAVENDLVGDGIDVAYATGERVQYEIFSPGCEVYAFVNAAAPAIAKGDALESSGNGTLRKVVAEPAVANTVGIGEMSNSRDAIVGYALEAVDNSGGGSAVRIKIEVA